VSYGPDEDEYDPDDYLAHDETSPAVAAKGA
jgi:hypothetical protein